MENGDQETSSIFRGYSGACDHSLLHLPYPLSQMGYAYGEDSIFVCGGTSDIGGGDQGIRQHSQKYLHVAFGSLKSCFSRCR